MSKKALAPLTRHRSVAELWVEDAETCRAEADTLSAAAMSFLELDEEGKPGVPYAKDLASVAAAMKTAAQLRKQSAESLAIAQERHEAERLRGKKAGMRHKSPQMKRLLAQKKAAERSLERLERIEGGAETDGAEVIDVEAKVA